MNGAVVAFLVLWIFNAFNMHFGPKYSYDRNLSFTTKLIIHLIFVLAIIGVMD